MAKAAPDGSLHYLSSAEAANSEDALRAPWQSQAATSNPLAVFSPVAIMKNTVVKRGGNSSQFQSWTVQPSLETIPTHQPLVVLRPPIPSAVTLQAAGEKKDSSSDLLPIMNSCAEIAPQPYKRGLEDRGETSRQKRLCFNGTDASSDQVISLPSGLCHRAPLASRPPRNFLRQDVPGRNAAVAHGFQHISVVKPDALGCGPVSSTPASPASESRAWDVVQSASYRPLMAGRALSSSSDLPLQRPSKNKCFQNTLVVLHTSGLLEIMLKTRKLTSQNLVTQAELDQLKEQTQLFMEALEAPQAWAELEASNAIR
uniref:CLOCK-interacting pacemaker n=1 Tax=Euleptes europaea TaxID=460621 RepID=UPI00253F78EA|nr:CLOCK-interacting pacemaker [Euleptes europaea]